MFCKCWNKNTEEKTQVLPGICKGVDGLAILGPADPGWGVAGGRAAGQAGRPALHHPAVQRLLQKGRL